MGEGSRVKNPSITSSKLHPAGYHPKLAKGSYGKFVRINMMI
jgi:hypothetical protein